MAESEDKTQDGLDDAKHLEVFEVNPADTPEFKERERRVVRKLDIFIAPLMGAFNFISYLCRSNIGFAATQGMTKDLNLVGSNLNAAVSLFYVLYVFSELPISMVAKKWKFERVLPTLTVSFGAVTLGAGFIHNYGSLVATRLLLGLFEGCLFPCVALFVANWYKREEMAVRVGFLFASTALAGAFGGLLSYGIFHMDGTANIAGWRWIYIIEGIVTIVFGLACFYLVPSSFEKAYFFNEEDKKIMRYRAELTHKYSGGSGHFKMRDIWIAVKDPKTWCHGWIQFCVITPLYAFSQFLPIIIEDGLGYDTLQAQYLTIPVQLWGAIIYMVIAWLSDRYRKRFLFLAIFTPITGLGYLLLLCPIPAGAQYFSTFLITTGAYIISGNNLAWASANSAPDGKRGATVGIVLTLTDLAGVVVGQIYPHNDAPKFYLGNAWTFGVVMVGLLLFCLVTWIYKKRNAEKERRLAAGEVVPPEQWDDQAPDFIYQT
ncbi:high-affinity nicotinic acid transporter [Niveomyces insectorum RCEF 264]|uniref:High-affinity nicotinic acid transporter n=1 Tax=Niveomyces insectorum RCEF 264 TaxID=1081102 RepID=A0A162KAY5_9HYPO|nr:high-affinity nicotinic acid transporter [Niveomyces insectorum RCEF 264]